MAVPTATVAANSDDGHAVLPTTDALFVFLEGLRRDGFRITAGQIAAAQRLLLDAHAGGPDTPTARRLKYRLTPLIAKSAQEQEDFYQRFDEVWRGPASVDRVEPVRHTAGAASEVIRRDRRRRILAAAVALFLTLAGLATWWLWTPPTQPSSQPDPVPPVSAEVSRAHDLPPEWFEIRTREVSPFYPGVKVVFTSLPAFMLLAWFLVRWRRRRLWLSRGIALGDAQLATLLLPPSLAGGLFTGPDFRGGANDLRQHRWLPTRQLDVRRTVEATAHRAGLFLPVWRERRQLPEYVFMIERDSANDHLAQLFDLAVDRLRDEHVVIQRYYFQGDPRQLLSDDEKRTPVPLAELAARTDDHRLFVIGTADGFFHPLTSDVESWVERLDPWRSRTLLSTKSLQEWGLPELMLLEEGFSLVTAEVQSFAAVGEKMAIGDDRAELLGGVVVKPAPASDPAPALASERAIGVEQPRVSDQERLAIRLLGLPSAQSLLSALLHEYNEEFKPDPALLTAADIARAFGRSAANDVLLLFWVVRRALQTVVELFRGDAERELIAQAAAALYLLAASRLVDVNAYASRSAQVPNFVVSVPDAEPLVCAVIANALFGGELGLHVTERSDLPSPTFVFDVTFTHGSEKLEDDFERAAYLSVLASDRETSTSALDSGPLSDMQRARLHSKLSSIRKVGRHTLGLIATEEGRTDFDACEKFANTYKVPVMLPSTSGENLLLGMSSDRLMAEIQEFWRDLAILRRTPERGHDVS